jgi:endonuclease I
MIKNLKTVKGSSSGIACIAMISGKTYARVKKDLEKLEIIKGRSTRVDFKGMKNILDHYRIKYSRIFNLDDYPVSSLKENALLAVNFDKYKDCWKWVVYDSKKNALRDPESKNELRTDFGKTAIHAFVYVF